MKFIYLAAPLILITGSVLSEDSCGSFRDSRGRSTVDFAPPKGFVDVCSRDFQLCVMLTEGYPPDVETIGYFVLTEEWQRYKKGKHKGFSRYLIAQRSRRPATEFVNLKQYVKSQQGDLPDNTKLPSILEPHGRLSLGVIDETEDSISTATIFKLAPTEGRLGGSFLLGCINIALELKDETLVLYVYDSVNQMTDTDRIRALANAWLKCIRTRNMK